MAMGSEQGGSEAKEPSKLNFPTTNQMPEMKIKRLLPALFTTLIISNGERLNEQEKQHARHLARVTDRALREYEDARMTLDFMLTKGIDGLELGYTWRFVEEMEDCIQNVARALRVVDSARSARSILQIDRQAKKAMNALGDDVVSVRNRIEHFESEIRSGSISAMVLWFVEDGSGVDLNNKTLRFRDLATVLEHLATISREWLVRYRDA